MIKMLMFGLISLVCAIVCSCTSKKVELEKITIGMAASLTSSLDAVAEAKGFFKEEGLDVEIKILPSGKVAMDQMLEGINDFASSSAFPVVVSSFLNSNFRLITSAAVGANDNLVIARKDSGIQGAKDLKGKKIGVIKGTTTHFVVDLLLLKNGMIQKDVNIIFSTPDELIEKIKNKSLDAICVFGVTADKAIAAIGNQAVVFTEESLVRVTTMITARVETLEKFPGKINKLLRAYIKAQEFIQKNSDEAFAIVIKRFELNKESAKKIWRPQLYRLALDQSLLLDMENIAKWFLENKLTNAEQVPNYINLIDFRFLEELLPSRVSIIHKRL